MTCIWCQGGHTIGGILCRVCGGTSLAPPPPYEEAVITQDLAQLPRGPTPRSDDALTVCLACREPASLCSCTEADRNEAARRREEEARRWRGQELWPVGDAAVAQVRTALRGKALRAMEPERLRLYAQADALVTVRIVGGHDGYEGAAAFSRCAAVLERSGMPHRLLVTHYEGGCAGGHALEEGEWQRLLGAGETLVLSQPAAAFPGAALWLIRPHLRHRDARLRALFTGGAPLRSGPGGVVVAVVSEPQLSHLRDAWCAEAVREAAALAARGDYGAAVAEGEQALVLARSLRLAPVAFVAELYQLAGRREEADALVAAAARSR